MTSTEPAAEQLNDSVAFFTSQLSNAWLSHEKKRWDTLLEFLSSVESVLSKIEQSIEDRKHKVLVESLIKVLHLIDKNTFAHSRSETAEILWESLKNDERTFNTVERPQPRSSFMLQPGEPLWISAVKKWKQWSKTPYRDNHFNLTNSSGEDEKVRWRQQFNPRFVALYQLHQTLTVELSDRDEFQKAVADSLKTVNQLMYHLVIRDYDIDEDNQLTFSHAKHNDRSEHERNVQVDLKAFTDEIRSRKVKRLLEIEKSAQLFKSDLQNTLEIIDTIEVPSDNIQPERVEPLIAELRKQLYEDDEPFLKTERAFIGHITLYKELTELQINALDLRDELYAKVNNRFNNLMFGNTETVIEKLQETREQLKTIRQLNEEDIQRQNITLHQLIEQELLEPLSDTESIDRFTEEVDLYKTDIQLFVNERSKQITIPTVWDNDSFPPKIVLRDLSWRQALNRIFYEQHLRNVDQMPDRYAVIINETRTEIISLTESLEVNLLAAVDLLDQSTEEKEKDTITYESIDRILTQFTDLLKEKKHILSSIQTEYKEQVEEVFAYLFNLLKNEKLDDLHQREKELQVKGRAIDWKTKLSARSAKIQDLSVLMFRFVIMKGRQVYHILAPWVGLEPLTASQDKDSKLLGDYLDELDAQFKSLPYIYRKVFDVYNQRDLRFFTGYGSELQIQGRHFSEWTKGSKRAVNVLGEIGSGKTTYLDKFVSNLCDDVPVKRLSINSTIYEEEDLIAFFQRAFDLEKGQLKTQGKKTSAKKELAVQNHDGNDEISTRSDLKLSESEEGYDEVKEMFRNVEELISWFKKQPPTVIVVEGVHNMFLRVVEGFGALELFYLILSESAGNIHWVTSINRHSWEYLDKVIGLRQFYSQVVATDHLTVDQLKEIIEKRHSTTGFQMRFEPDAEIADERAYKKVMDDEEARQNYLKKRIFQNIMVTAKGNISIALLQWVRSVKSISKLEMVFEVKEDYTIKLPDTLSTDDLFTLAFFVQHGNVKIEEHALSFRQGVRKSRAQISKLAMQSFIIKDEERESYSLNPLVYRPVIRALTSKNILH